MTTTKKPKTDPTTKPMPTVTRKVVIDEALDHDEEYTARHVDEAGELTELGRRKMVPEWFTKLWAPMMRSLPLSDESAQQLVWNQWMRSLENMTTLNTYALRRVIHAAMLTTNIHDEKNGLAEFADIAEACAELAFLADKYERGATINSWGDPRYDPRWPK